ncbi:RluA family pseudouridine synthase [Aureimonas fodinaquatilis]|uniref:RluA family pseudouridine synthase n=1 Tax=Aureimonas fodinaquatilis TaxID=2565783 RepID=UPI001FE5B46A|nr:RluA family pseudouridine synthase [Aureimonas fodinaquatilis]
MNEELTGSRLDQFLNTELAGKFSRSRIQALIVQGAVTLNGQAILQSKHRVVTGEHYMLAVPEPTDAAPAPEAITLNVLYEDTSLIVIDKPAGLVVHPGAGNWTGTLVNALLHHCGDSLSGIGGVKRPGIVHRLDKETSGVLVVAKNDLAHRKLAEQFAAHGRDGQMQRVYLALVWNIPERREGKVNAPLARSMTDRTKRSVVPAGRPDARHAVTHYRVEKSFTAHGADAALVSCRLETGRTHQIRVHMAHIGHPLIGDGVYGAGFRSKSQKLDEPLRALVENFTRQALHASMLTFVHPGTEEVMRFESPMPKDMQDLVTGFS